MQGIDVSKWNGSNDFNRAKATVCGFILVTKTTVGY